MTELNPYSFHFALVGILFVGLSIPLIEDRPSQIVFTAKTRVRQDTLRNYAFD